jgi:hypothetical protein
MIILFEKKIGHASVENENDVGTSALPASET